MIEMIILQSHQSFYNFINWQFPFWQAHFVRLALIKKTFPFHHNQPSKAIALIFENKYSSTLSKLKSSFLFSKKFQSYLRNMVLKLVFKKKCRWTEPFEWKHALFVCYSPSMDYHEMQSNAWDAFSLATQQESISTYYT